MSLLNAVLGFGALAFSVPLLIHLLTRSRHQRVDWGAMHLLESAVTSNQRRLRIEQLLLLLIRCAIPVLLALTMARPVLTGWKTLLGNAPQSLVILLDNSYSMATGSEQGTRMERARTAVSHMLAQLPNGSDAMVVATGGAPLKLTDKPTFDRKLLIDRVARIDGDCGSVPVDRALDEGMSILAAMSHAHRELVVVSDFQATDWQELDSGVTARIVEQVRSLPIQPRILLFPVAETTTVGPRKNIAIESITISNRMIAISQWFDVLISVRCDDGVERVSVDLTPYVDGSAQPPQKVALTSGAVTQVSWRGSFAEPGSHGMEFVIDANDELVADNRRGFIVQVAPRAKVLLLDGDRRGGPLQSETEYLSIALAPFAFGGLSTPDAYVTESLTANELNEKRMQGNQAVVLANVDRLNDAQVQMLLTFVEQGGFLTVFLGDKVQADWYNKHLLAKCSLRLAKRAGNPQGTDATVHILHERFAHRGLDYLNSVAAEDLAKATIRAWWQLLVEETPTTGSASSSATNQATSTILARFANQDPWWVESTYGRGRMLVCATACDLDWSDLPTQPFYLPLIHNLFASGLKPVASELNLQTGDVITQKLTALESNTERREVVWTTSQGLEHPATAVVHEGVYSAEYRNTQRPGIYELNVEGETNLQYAVNAPASESHAASLSAASLNDLARSLGATVVASADAYVKSHQQEQFGRDISLWFWIGLLGLLFGEPWFSQWLARDSRA